MTRTVSRQIEGRARESRARLLLLWTAVAAITTCGNHVALSTFPMGVATQTSAPGWQTYRDTTFGFSIDYPEDYVVLPPLQQLPRLEPQLLRSVRFQRRGVAHAEIPLFTVDVFARSGLPLREWLEAARRLPRDARGAPFTVNGAADALHVRLLREIAPNEFYYVATASYVFVLTPLGGPAQRMVASFRLISQGR